MNTSLSLPEFDTLVALHQKDPVAYESLRKNLLQECVNAAPEQYRPMLDGIVLEMERARESAKSPFEAATIAACLMTESLERMCVRLFDLQEAKATWHTGKLLARLVGKQVPGLPALPGPGAK